MSETFNGEIFSVDERLPDNNHDILIHVVDDTYVKTGLLEDALHYWSLGSYDVREDLGWRWRENNCRIDGRVTHWSELPPYPDQGSLPPIPPESPDAA